MSGHLGEKGHWSLGALSNPLLYSQIILLDAELMQIHQKLLKPMFQICKVLYVYFLSFFLNFILFLNFTILY